MIRYDRRYWLLAICLSALAGFVDALGFIKLGGFFVSFMSGNSTRAGVGVMTVSKDALTALSLIALFVTGVVIGSLVAHAAGQRRKPIVLLVVAALLASGAAFDLLVFERMAVAAIVMAMGAANTIFQRDGEVSIGVTYMTGTLVKTGQRIAAALLGHNRFDWVPYFLLWFGLFAGAIAGAATYPVLELQGLWIAAGIAAALSVFANRLSPNT